MIEEMSYLPHASACRIERTTAYHCEEISTRFGYAGLKTDR